jgi:hypothetical protein
LIARPSGRAISLWDKELAHFGKNDTKTILCQEKAKNTRVNGTVNKLSTKSGKTGHPMEAGWRLQWRLRLANIDFSKDGRIPELSGITGLKMRTAGGFSVLAATER